MRPSERSKLLAYVEELGETDRGSNAGAAAQNQTFESETGSGAHNTQPAQRKEQPSIELQEMQYVGKKSAQEKIKLDQNKVKSDEFFEVEIGQADEEHKDD